MLHIMMALIWLNSAGILFTTEECGAYSDNDKFIYYSGDGNCDECLNTMQYEWDGGDCCQQTCRSSSISANCDTWYDEFGGATQSTDLKPHPWSELCKDPQYRADLLPQYDQ